MTNHWIDIKNSDVILSMGSNPAENHPISFRWLRQAMDNGTMLINVDPRFTRTSAMADIYAPIRSGTDIAFLGGLIKYILDNDLYHRQYVLEHTNAPFLINSDFKFNAGIFCGYDPEKRSYDKADWTYQTNGAGNPLEDPSLKDPHCVLQLLKKHYGRYDVGMVSQITGTPEEGLKRIYRSFAANRATVQGGDDHVCHGLDTAHLRHPKHQGGSHHPVASGQYRKGGRGYQRPAW